jgi:hypothetical protein
MSFLTKLLAGGGRFSPEQRAQLDAEGAEILEDGLRGTVTWRDYRAPHRYSSFRKKGVYVAIALTARRLLVQRTGGKEIDVPFEHPGFAAIEASLDEPDRLCIAFDPGAFDPRASGRIELRLSTPQAGRILERLQMLRVTRGR